MISPKIEIINHFDELINQVDIEFEEFLEKYNNEKSVLGDIKCEKFGELKKRFYFLCHQRRREEE